MYGFELAVAGRLDAAFEQSVVEVLGTMGLVVRERVVTSQKHARASLDARVGERPTLALHACRMHDTEMVTARLRGLRHPAHGLMLAQGLSCRVQGFAGAMINDRLTGHYGLGFFFAGFPLEGLLRTPSCETARFGTHPHVAVSRLVASSTEEMNHAAWKVTGAALTGATPPWTSGESETVHAFVVEGAAGESAHDLDERCYRASRPIPNVYHIAPAAFSCATVAGLPLSRLEDLAERARVDRWRSRIERLAPTYDVVLEGDTLDETERPVLLLASTHPPDGLRRLVEQAGATATVAYLVPDAVETWSKTRSSSWEHRRLSGAAALASAWSPITTLLSVGPIHFSFGSCGPQVRHRA